MAEVCSDGSAGEEQEDRRSRKTRGRPRLTDIDRARRRLESRKKYDVRRVYLGEAHEAWVQLRGRSGWSDARLAAYLLSLERVERGQTWQQVSKSSKWNKRRRQNVNCMKNLVIWYEDHRNRCTYEPLLIELGPLYGLYTTAVWQCEDGHRYFQDLRSPLKPVSDSETDCERVANGVEVRNSDSSDEGTSWEDEQQLVDHKTNSHNTSSQYEATPIGDLSQPFEQQHMETLNTEQVSQDCRDHHRSCDTERLDTVVCMPVQVGNDPGSLFDGVTPDSLGEVVGGCPMQSMVQGSQVIIIAGHGYEPLEAEGIELNVNSSSSNEELPCSMMESVAAYTQTDPESTDATEQLQLTDDLEYIETKIEQTELYTLAKESGDEVQRAIKPELHSDVTLEQELKIGRAISVSDSKPLMNKTTDSTTIVEVPKELEKRSKRGQLTDADGVLEMFHCPYEGCSQVYVALSSFQNHVNLVHRKGRTKVCPHPGCGKKFYLSNHLGRHMIIHSGVREFICETCGKSFKRKNHLDVHRRTHTGETPLQCEICGYQCRQRASLNWHMKKHTSEVQYKFTCEHCGKPFEKLDSVKFHKLKSHPDVKAT